MRKWYFAISPSPQRVSRSGSVASASRSQITPDGCQNAPTRFLPSGRLTPVLPPIAASTMPSSVVDTCTTGVPRCHEAAAKPATSVTIPPPTPTTTSSPGQSLRGRTRASSVSIVASDLARLAVADHVCLDLVVGQRDRNQRDAGLGDHGDAASRRRQQPGELGDRARPRRRRRRSGRRAERSRGSIAAPPSRRRDGERWSTDTIASATSWYSGARTSYIAPQRALGIVVEQRSMGIPLRTRSTQHVDVGEQPHDVASAPLNADAVGLAEHDAAGAAAITDASGSASASTSVSVSSARNAASPSLAQISRTVRPVRASIISSESNSGRPSSAATHASHGRLAHAHHADEHEVRSRQRGRERLGVADELVEGVAAELALRLGRQRRAPPSSRRRRPSPEPR